MRSRKPADLPLAAGVLMLAAMGCSRRRQATYKDGVQKALEQADDKGMPVGEGADNNTITLAGKLHPEDAKQKAAEVAQSAAANRVVENEICVQPPGVEAEARKVHSNLDEGMESNHPATLISKGLDRQDISSKSKNGVLTMSGRVRSGKQRQQAEPLAGNTPNVAQVLNQIDGWR